MVLGPEDVELGREALAPAGVGGGSAVVLGGGVVGATGQRGTPISLSSDGGRRWRPAEVAGAVASTPRLLDAGGGTVVASASRPEGPMRVVPEVWTSTDGGRHFHGGAGEGEDTRGGGVTAAVRVPDGSLLIGGRLQGGGPSGLGGEAGWWRSTDDGRHWSAVPVSGLAGTGQFVSPAWMGVVRGRVVLTGVDQPVRPTGDGRVDHARLAIATSADSGRTWRRSEVGGDVGMAFGPEAPAPWVVGDRLVLPGGDAQSLLVSDDGGGRWTATARPPLPPGAEARPQFTGVVGAGGRWVASTTRVAGDHGSEAGLVVTSDGGRTWAPRALPGARCVGDEVARESVSVAETSGGTLIALWTCESTGPSGASGVASGRLRARAVLYRSTDHGDSWQAFWARGLPGGPLGPLGPTHQHTLLATGDDHQVLTISP